MRSSTESTLLEARRPSRGEELLALPVLAAVVLTGLNDHVGKAVWPGFVTGKISDFTGLFFFPFLLTTLRGDLLWILRAAVLTALLFLVVKLVGIDLPVCRVAADPTDLAALVSPLAAVLYARRRWPCAFSRSPVSSS